MELITKGARVCVTCFVGGVVTLLWLILDMVFKAIRLIRYGFLKAFMYSISRMDVGTNCIKSCNKILCFITEQDINDSAKTKELRL